MFKSIANFGSGAVSVAQAEFNALQYYWWFMVLTAFTGQLLANMVINAFKEGSLGTEFATVLRQVATTIPSTLSATWLNWIIFRVTLTLPMNYLLNINTFAFAFLGWNCCSRMVRGGGPGGPTPYRLYVDTGTVLVSFRKLIQLIVPFNTPDSVLLCLMCEDVLHRAWSFKSACFAGLSTLLFGYGTIDAKKSHLCLSTQV